MTEPDARPDSNSKRNILRDLCLAAGLWPFVVYGADVGLAGLFPGKALLTINGGAPRIVAVGTRTAEGVGVVAIEGETATIEVDGKRRVLRVGRTSPRSLRAPARPAWC